MRINKYLLLIFLVSLIIFYPSLSKFYTNDDFFLLKISQANNFPQFINFFNPTAGPDGLGMYRPLTTQVFYFLARKLFNLNPLGLHVISLGVFFLVIFLIYKLAKELTGSENISLVASFLYATSATHFGHLYYLATFQELGITLFFLLSVLGFIRFLRKEKAKDWLLSLLAFALALLSKETAVVLPLALFLVYFYLNKTRQISFSLKKLTGVLSPYILLLVIYFYFRIFHYGFAEGDSYIWDFSIGRTINTLGWYGLWSLNLPEMLVDFVGPGLKFNPNLFKFWSREIIPIFVLFGTLLAGIGYMIIKNYKKLINRKSLILILFCLSWFIITLLPVLFLPLHKFTFYLTIPLVGAAIAISYLLVPDHERPITTLFLAAWLSLSIVTLTLTAKTSWITKGQETARRIHNYFLENTRTLEQYKTIVFYDTEKDKELPWSPSETLKVILSDQNYFKVFWNDKFIAKYYNSKSGGEGKIMLQARQFLGY